VVAALAGAAALLAVDSVRERAPRALATVWLAVVALGQLAVAGKALSNAVSQDLGPDTAVGVLMTAAALAAAAVCLAAVRSGLRPAAPAGDPA
jgi:hypothetical protein